jgi:hypothetical protein
MTAQPVDRLKERSTGELIRELSEQVRTLARQEIELAKAEMTEKGKHAGVGAGLLAGAAVAGLLTLGAMTAVLILALAEAIPAWGGGARRHRALGHVRCGARAARKGEAR